MRRAWAGTRYGLAVLAVDQGDATAARPLLERNLAILGELGDEAGAAQTYIVLEAVAMLCGEVGTASALPAEGRALSRELGDQSGISRQLNMAGLLAHMGDDAKAASYYEQSLAIARDQVDETRTATALHNLGMAACNRHDYPAALALRRPGSR